MIRRLTVIAAACLGLLALAPALAGAASIIVTTTADVTAEDSFCSLREAVTSANTNAGNPTADCTDGESMGTDFIRLENGETYSLTGAAGDDSNASGDLDVASDAGPVQIDNASNGSATAPPVINAGGLDRVLHLTSSPSSTVLSIVGVALTNGKPPGLNDDGGAVLISDADSRLSVEKSLISNSHAPDYGGAISIQGSTSANPLSMISSELVGNSAGDHGGAVYLHTTSFSPEASIDRSTLTGNVSAGSGGAIYLGSFEELGLRVVNSTLTGNSAAQGGGAIGSGVDAVDLIADFSTIASNTTTRADGAGGIQLDHDSQRLTLRGTILAYNTAAGVAANCAKVAPATGEVEPLEPDSTHNLESANTCGLDASAPNDLIGVDPLLAPLADNGGLTRTRGLYDGSPARDHVPAIGDVDYCLPSGGFDQRGVSRLGIGDSFCDVGAFEGSVGPVPVVQPPAVPPPVAQTSTPFDLGAAIKKCKKKFKGKKKSKKRKKCIRKARQKAASG